VETVKTRAVETLEYSGPSFALPAYDLHVRSKTTKKAQNGGKSMQYTLI
jgi:hypothetical protein